MDYQDIINQASEAGSQAARAFTEKHPGFEGACGFAWVNIPGNTAFGRWANKNKIARPAYPKGLTFWCPLMTQSMSIKEEWAWAFAGVLQQHGIEASASSRMD